MNIGDRIITEDGIEGVIIEVTDSNQVQGSQDDDPQVWYGVRFLDMSFYGEEVLYFNECQVYLNN